MRVFLTGATGFVGSHLRRALVRNDFEVTALVRRPPAAEPGVTWVVGDLLDPRVLAEGMQGCQAVIHLVGIIREQGEATFARMHVQATEQVLAAMRRAHVTRLLHMSALGAGPKPPSEYYRTKWLAEELVRATGLDYTIFRPSIIFGPGDGFVSLLAQQIRQFPVLPIIGSGEYPLAPISIRAVVSAFLQALALDGATQAKTIELCGPEVLTYLQMLDIIAARLHVKKSRVHIPVPLMSALIGLAQGLHFPLPITRDEMRMLLLGNVCSDDSTARAVFDLPHITLAEGIREYL